MSDEDKKEDPHHNEDDFAGFDQAINNLDLNENMKPQPISIQKMSSTDSSQDEDSFVGDLNRNEFSISIVKADVVSEQQEQAQGGGGYLSSLTSYWAPSSSQYAEYRIETRSQRIIYESASKIHTVLRRFSDFEYLLRVL